MLTLKVDGNAHLAKSVVSGKATIPGVESLDIADFTKIQSSTFSGKKTIVGLFEAKKTTFSAKYLTLIVEGDEPACLSCRSLIS